MQTQTRRKKRHQNFSHEISGVTPLEKKKQQLIGRPRLPLQKPIWPSILRDQSHRCQSQPLGLIALCSLAALLELTLNFSLVVRRRCWAFLLDALAV